MIADKGAFVHCRRAAHRRNFAINCRKTAGDFTEDTENRYVLRVLRASPVFSVVKTTTENGSFAPVYSIMLDTPGYL